MKMTMVIWAMIIAVCAFAGNGEIKGMVTDAETGEALAGVNIQVFDSSDTTQVIGGAATDFDGKYFILNLRPGIYRVKASYVGYNSEIKTNVAVSLDRSTVVDFALKAPHYECEVVITADRLAISKDVTHSMAFSDFIDPDFNTEEYDYIEETGYKDVMTSPLSTFSVDVDAASYSNCRRFIMQSQLPPPDAVRIEEFINYFDYDYPQPESSDPFSINLEYSTCPWDESHNLVHIGLKGKELDSDDLPPSNLVFLIDVSGSMNSPDKLPLVQKSLNILLENLREEDRIAIVVYAGAAGLVLPSTSGADKEKITGAINRLQAGGSTAGGAGLQLAYNVAIENFIEGGNNRVILSTDGDFNIGVSNTGELTRMIEEYRDKGVFLTCTGFGTGNYKDSRLQELADRGNGNHAYIDNILEAKKVFGDEILATLFVIAKDVKIQVEFNPAKVESYRLIGYENRRLEDEDFVDDTKDAGEIGSGHTVTALYEIVPASEESAREAELKYQETKITEDAMASDEILTVKFRYKEPDGKKSKELIEVLSGSAEEFDKTSDNFRWSSAVAEFAMILSDSKFGGESSLEQVEKIAKNALGKDEYGYRHEFLQLVERVKLLQNNEERDEISD